MIVKISKNDTTIGYSILFDEIKSQFHRFYSEAGFANVSEAYKHMADVVKLGKLKVSKVTYRGYELQYPGFKNSKTYFVMDSADQCLIATQSKRKAENKFFSVIKSSGK